MRSILEYWKGPPGPPGPPGAAGANGIPTEDDVRRIVQEELDKSEVDVNTLKEVILEVLKEHLKLGSFKK